MHAKTEFSESRQIWGGINVVHIMGAHFCPLIIYNNYVQHLAKRRNAIYNNLILGKGA